MISHRGRSGSPSQGLPGVPPLPVQRSHGNGAVLPSDTGGMRRTPFGTVFEVIHHEAKWETQGGSRSTSRDSRGSQRFERDASIVDLLNVIDPQSLVDQARRRSLKGDENGSARRTRRADSTEFEQHSALSGRGVIFAGGLSALLWYVLRLIVRDRLGLGCTKNAKVLEMRTLSTFHALCWVIFLIRKVGCTAEELPKYCSRALVASLGFYIHDCWALREMLLQNPTMFAHQASVALTISSILRSKGVTWLAPLLMCLTVPTLAQEVLLICATIGLSAARPEVRGLRFLWFFSFAASKFALLPCFLRNRHLPELHQPTLFLGKIGYLISLSLDLSFILRAAQDLPSFLKRKGPRVPAAIAYATPLRGVQAAATAVIAGGVLGTIFGSYMVAPAAGFLALLTLLGKTSRNMKMLTGLLCSVVALDLAVPMPKDCHAFLVKLFLPILQQCTKAFNHRIYPQKDLSSIIKKDRNYLLAVTPHGFFPWGAAMLVFELFSQGYLPNFLGADVLGVLPVASRLLRILGFRPASRKEIKICLSKPYPRNVTVILPGGIAEMFSIRPDIEISQTNLRKGFVECAVAEGAMLIPCFSFGNSQLYQVAQGAMGQLFETISRKFKVSLNLFSGRWGTLLPYPHPLACALGEPIDTRVVTNVNEVQKRWIEGLRRTFNEHKADFGWPDRELYFAGEAMPPPPEHVMETYTAYPQLSKL